MTDQAIGGLTAYGEARGEPIAGVIAVINVIGNRWRDGRWGTRWEDICLAPAQFSCWLPGDPNYAALKALEATIGTADHNDVLECCWYLANQGVLAVLQDLTGGATHYFNPAGVTHPPAWSRPPAVHTVTIGHHQFYRNVA